MSARGSRTLLLLSLGLNLVLAAVLMPRPEGADEGEAARHEADTSHASLREPAASREVPRLKSKLPHREVPNHQAEAAEQPAGERGLDPAEAGALAASVVGAAAPTVASALETLAQLTDPEMRGAVAGVLARRWRELGKPALGRLERALANEIAGGLSPARSRAVLALVEELSDALHTAPNEIVAQRLRGRIGQGMSEQERGLLAWALRPRDGFTAPEWPALALKMARGEDAWSYLGLAVSRRTLGSDRRASEALIQAGLRARDDEGASRVLQQVARTLDLERGNPSLLTLWRRTPPDARPPLARAIARATTAGGATRDAAALERARAAFTEIYGQVIDLGTRRRLLQASPSRMQLWARIEPQDAGFLDAVSAAEPVVAFAVTITEISTLVRRGEKQAAMRALQTLGGQ